MTKSFLKTLTGQGGARRPVWFMRQAGRYLPEYRETRAKAGSFLDLCYAPALAEEVTLQPLRRFDLDAAILFADILLVPDGLGQNVAFKEGEGPEAKAGDTLEVHYIGIVKANNRKTLLFSVMHLRPVI